LFDLRADPYERADITSNTYYDWFISQPYLAFAANVETARFLATFKEFPPRQRAASFSIDQAVDKMKQNLGGN
jgi:arylsulfatase